MCCLWIGLNDPTSTQLITYHTQNEGLQQELTEFKKKYQKLSTDLEKQIDKTLTEITLKEKQIINQTILFLGTKELFINHRQATINNLIDSYNKLEKRLGSKLNKFTTAVSMTNIAGKLASIIPGGGVAETPVRILGDTINLTGTIVQGKDLEKFTKQFQAILAQDEKNMFLFDESYQLLIKAIWYETSNNSQGEITTTIIEILKLVKSKQVLFSKEHNVFNISDIWKSRPSLELGEMKNAILLLKKDLERFEQEAQQERNQLTKQIWFNEIEKQTNLLERQQTTQIQQNSF